MTPSDNYFQEQVNAASNYFEDWIYSRNCNTPDVKNKTEQTSYYSQLHSTFSSIYKSHGLSHTFKHNCIGCNLEEGAKNIELFFKYNKNVQSERYFLTLFTMLFYLQAERMAVIYSELGFIKIQRKKKVFDWCKTPELLRIKYWANFFKHPKAYMLLHHPSFFIQGDPNIPNFMVNEIIDEKFIQTFYKGDEKNLDLRDKLLNKDGVIIIFPNLVKFTKDLCREFEKLVDLIVSDEKHILQLANSTSLNQPQK